MGKDRGNKLKDRFQEFFKAVAARPLFQFGFIVVVYIDVGWGFRVGRRGDPLLELEESRSIRKRELL